MLNEFMVSKVVYTSVIFSEMAQSQDQKYFYGWVMIGLVSSTFTFNMAIVFWISVKKLWVLI